MTAVITTNAWALQGLQLGINEIASSIAVGKLVGSLFTRKEDAQIFEVLQDQHGIAVSRLPVWLRDIAFERQTYMYADSFRRLQSPTVMSDVESERLQGVATFLIICARYAEPKKHLQLLLEELLSGDLGSIVRPPAHELHEYVFYSIRPLLRNFIEGCLDSDADSRQARDTKQWLADLTGLVSSSFTAKPIAARRLQGTRSLLRDLLQHHAVDSTLDGKVTGASTRDAAWVHNTMHMAAAYIGLAAAANGANVMIHCMGKTKDKWFPETRHVDKQSFVVRFWLRQPPSDISATLNSISLEGVKASSDNDTVVYGGQMEIAVCCARDLSYTARHAEPDYSSAVMELWTAGREIANHIRWHAAGWEPDRSTPESLLRLQLSCDRLSDQISAPAVELSKALRKADRHFQRLSRTVAAALHKLYNLSDYTGLLASQQGAHEIQSAAQIVITSLAICLIGQQAGFLSSQAANRFATVIHDVTDASGFVWSCLRESLQEGCSISRVIQAVATIWGGGRAPSPPVAGSGHTLGFVAPQCFILLQILLLPQVRNGPEDIVPLLVICHGAVPMLPRDKHTSWILSPPSSYWPGPNNLSTLHERDLASSFVSQPNGDLIVRFDPVVDDPSRGVFCCWVNGHLLFEIDPYRAQCHLLRPCERSGLETAQTFTPEQPKWLLPHKLFELGHFQLGERSSKRDHPVIFYAGTNSLLAICIAGLSPEGTAGTFWKSPNMLSLDEAGSPNSSNVVILLEKEKEIGFSGRARSEAILATM